MGNFLTYTNKLLFKAGKQPVYKPQRQEIGVIISSYGLHPYIGHQCHQKMVISYKNRSRLECPIGPNRLVGVPMQFRLDLLPLIEILWYVLYQ